MAGRAPAENTPELASKHLNLKALSPKALNFKKKSGRSTNTVLCHAMLGFAVRVVILYYTQNPKPYTLNPKPPPP